MFKRKNKKNDIELIFNTKSKENLEDLMERPLENKIFISFYIFLFFITIIFIIKLFNMQIIDYDKYAKEAKDNFIKTEVLFTNRGIVTDKNGIELIWNEPAPENKDLGYSIRKYKTEYGLAHILGFLSYPKKDKYGHYFTKEYTGKAGIEKYYNEYLNGILGKRIFKVDSKNHIISDNTIVEPKNGKNLSLTIDLRLQKYLYESLKDYLEKDQFIGGGAMIMNVKTGEILASVSLPEYDPNVLSNKTDNKLLKKYFKDTHNVFLNRNFLGGYTPGSIVKPFVGLFGLENKVITRYTSFKTTGKLILPNKWDPSKPTIFSDWKNHGRVNLNKAIAFSSNIYFYIVGGGLHNILHYRDREGLGIQRLDKGYKDFNFGELTGIEKFKEKQGLVPNPEWKKKIFKQKWNIGNTYFTSIGQFGFLVTPLQVLTAVSAIANNGKIFKPIITKNEKIEILKDLKYSKQNFQIIRAAMRETNRIGTTSAYLSKKVIPFLDMGTKSGTAQIKNNTRNNAWVIGFWPYKNPKYAFVVLGDDGPIKHRSASVVIRDFFWKLKEANLNEYLE